MVTLNIILIHPKIDQVYEKTINKNSVNSSLNQLDDENKIIEIARMMGGAVDSEQSLAHAREMLKSA